MATILADCPECHRKQANDHKKCISCGADLDQAKASNRVAYWIKYRAQGKQHLEKIGYSIKKAKGAQGKRGGQEYEKVFDPGSLSKITFSELAKWFLPIEENKILSGQITARYFKVKKIHLNTFNSFFGDRVVNTISPADLETFKAERKKAKLSDSYVDQELKSVGSMINSAFEHELVSARAFKYFKANKTLLKKKSANKRERVLSLAECNKLLPELPLHLRPVVAMAFWTGMRRGEVLNLTWDKVNLKKRMIHLGSEDTKEGQSKRVPVSKTLKAILKNIPQAIHDNHVFLYKGKPISNPAEGLKNGCEKAGIVYGQKEKDGFVFKDLRRTAKTNMRKAGIDRNLRMAIFGHSDGSDMESRYDAVDESDLVRAIDLLESYLLPPLDEMHIKK